MARFDFIAAYMMANRHNGAIYVGSASDLPVRVGAHKHQCFDLVWYERFESMSFAAAKERTLKRWNRVWKIELIEKTNKHWLDLSKELV
jgi:putative endonuclease